MTKTRAKSQPTSHREVGRRVLETEAEAVRLLAERIGPEFDRAVDAILSCTGRVVTTGMGKSGIICKKLAATLASTGTPAFFMHPAEAVHGDLGMVTAGDLVLAISNSGETSEILQMLERLKRLNIPIIAMTGTADCPLAQNSDIWLDVGVDREACPLGLAPTASTTAALALGDALAMAVLEGKGFAEEDFAVLHPGGKLGKKLLRVSDLMHKGDAMPCVLEGTAMRDVIYEMSKKGLGITSVLSPDGGLLGVISDGDLRRLLQARGDILSSPAGQCMGRSPITIAPNDLATHALAIMEERKITALMVVDERRKLIGVLHLHDLWRTQMV